MSKSIKRADGFSLIELLVAALIFTVVAGGIFSVLLGSQIRYQSDSGLTTAFQQANLAMDQITRDIHSAGYPPASSFSSTTVTYHPEYVAVAFPWSPNYPSSPCTISVCASPGDNDLLLETQGENGSGIQLIRYSLVGTTLLRGSVPKAQGDPLTNLPQNQMTPYLENVMNNPSADQMTAIQNQYPSMFSGGNAIPVFSYMNASGTQANQPPDIRSVNICLIVLSNRLDPQGQILKEPQTGQIRVVTVTGQAVAFNPNQ